MPSPLLPPLNLKAWIDEHRHALKPPVGEKRVYQVGGATGFIIAVVGGPTHRKDFHVNPTEELFFQVEGDVIIRVVDAHGEQHDIPVREGEMFLLPPGVPHSPQRPAGSVGLVVERPRPHGEDDQMLFYCEKCGEVVHEELFEAGESVVRVKTAMEAFWSDATLRTCMHCGSIVQPPTAAAPSVPANLKAPANLKVGKPAGGAASAPGRTPGVRPTGVVTGPIAQAPPAGRSSISPRAKLGKPAATASGPAARAARTSGKKKVVTRGR
jgi:3-hydroxyanthranilate 3,4-dioxygenase